MTNWNVYKVFSNGKRAKAPFRIFEAESADHFFNEILPTLSKKLQSSEWTVIDSVEPQEREEEQIDKEAEAYAKARTSMLENLAAEKFPHLSKHKAEVCLMLSANTDWKWAWCITEAVTNRYLGELSNRFKSEVEAGAWAKEQIECMDGI